MRGGSGFESQDFRDVVGPASQHYLLTPHRPYRQHTSTNKDFTMVGKVSERVLAREGKSSQIPSCVGYDTRVIDRIGMRRC